MKWANYRVTVRLIATGEESKITVRAVSRADAEWRAIHRSLDSRYCAVSAEKLE